LVKMNRGEGWEAVYHRAVLEVDRQKVLEHIVAARQAIGERLQGLTENPNHRAERQQIEDALRASAVLEREAQTWPQLQNK
jgi:hypothetical protein